MTMAGEATNQFSDTAIKIGFWYFFSVISPVTNKWVQQGFSFTNTLSILHLLTASIIGGLFCLKQAGQDVTMSLPHIHPQNPKPILPPFRVAFVDLMPLGITKFVGMMLLLFGLKNLPVSLVLTVKALDPIPTAIFTYLILGVRESWLVYSTVVPIIFGVILSTNGTHETTLSWGIVALSLVIVDALQNVITKYLLKKGRYTEFSLQFSSSSIALFFQLPVCIYYEGVWPLLDVLFLKIDSQSLFAIILACTAFYGQVIMAFLVMNKVTNLTYSVCNILKRVIQLIFAVLVFQNQISFSNAAGMLLAMFGISLYTIVRSMKSSK
eukprot:Phypoly_transcript_12575.p1 GENE.Phypoly_transcript_12575~~Phypoly_transcript_12575.p1  ORF type:complete len:324 (-),score=41.45 Phypoly_transcript_12575:16-987(-)